MLPEDGILLTYVLKQSQEDSEIEAVDSPTKPEAKAAECSVDNHEIGENSQKSCKMMEVIEDTVVPSTSSPVVEDDNISEEEAMGNQPVMSSTMVDKLTKTVNNLGSKIKKEKSLKVPAINLILRIQLALDECGFFPENSTVDILDIINMIPDKSAAA